MKYTAAAYMLTIAIISFLGYCVENIWLAVTQQYINNRNMYFPFLLGYGLAVVGIYLIVGTPKKWLKRKSSNGPGIPGCTRMSAALMNRGRSLAATGPA